jgi:hypothetical protein
MDLGKGGTLVNKLDLASGHEDPLNTHIEVAADAAEEDSSDTKSDFSDQAVCFSGKENATPGYERTYVPYSEASFGSGRTYSPGYDGPKSRL